MKLNQYDPWLAGEPLDWWDEDSPYVPEYATEWEDEDDDYPLDPDAFMPERWFVP